MPKNELLTVPLTSAQRDFVRGVAEAESTSEAAVAIEITYAPKEPGGTAAACWKVAMTS